MEMKENRRMKNMRFFSVIVVFCMPVIIVGAQVSGLRIGDDQTRSISQFGITWHFENSVKYGKYINGDYWVVGPVTITEITRPANSTIRDGSMINPIPSINLQGYDDRWAEYVPFLNVANQLPLQVGPGSSLISAISRNPEVVGTRVRPLLRVAAVLTVVDAAQLFGVFRPAYAGTRKIAYSSQGLRTDLLLSLPPVSNTPLLAETAALFEKPWIDHVLGWQGDDFHPEENLNNYGAGISLNTSMGALRLMLNDSVTEKNTLLIRYIQLGIDNLGLVENGANWGDLGGTIGPGRKLPILFAGLMLDNDDMKNVAINYNTRQVFQEDHQTLYLTQEARDATYNSVNCNAGPDYCNEGWYDSLAIGLPVWGERAYRWETTTYPYLPGKLGYRALTYRASMGSSLITRMLGIEKMWNHPPFLEWTDRLRSEIDNGAWGSQFVFNMWDQYRSLY